MSEAKVIPEFRFKVIAMQAVVVHNGTDYDMLICWIGGAKHLGTSPTATRAVVQLREYIDSHYASI